MSVADADKALANGDLDGRFAAIGGYWHQFALPCPFLPHMPPIQGFCSGGVFADAPQDENSSGGIGGDTTPIAMPETLNGDLLWQFASHAAAPVVVIVHAADSRAYQCAPDPEINCREHMVIDDVAWVNGSATAMAAGADSDVGPRMSLQQVVSAAVKPGEQLMMAYALPTTHMNDIDPRLIGDGSGTVWVVRTAEPPADGNGTAAGTVHLVDDATGAVLDELPLAVDPGYQPARVVLDSSGTPGGSDNGADAARYSLLQGQNVLAGDQLDMGTAPLTIRAGSYLLHAYVVSGSNEPSATAGGPTCDQQIVVAGGDDVAYTASFSGSKCSWGPSPTSPS